MEKNQFCGGTSERCSSLIGMGSNDLVRVRVCMFDVCLMLCVETFDIFIVPSFL